MENYDNPVPGAVMLVRARMDDGRLGLLCVDRDLEPKGPALPGGQRPASA